MNRFISNKYPELFEREGGVFNFHGLGNALAMGIGCADGMHIDYGDSVHTMAIIFSAGDAMVFFCVPQLNIRVPLYPGQFLTISARTLMHYAYMFEGGGDRILFNFFTDDCTVAKAMRHFGLRK